MPITPQQKQKIVKILMDFKRDVRKVVKKHKGKVVEKITLQDQEQAQRILNQIKTS